MVLFFQDPITPPYRCQKCCPNVMSSSTGNAVKNSVPEKTNKFYKGNPQSLNAMYTIYEYINYQQYDDWSYIDKYWENIQNARIGPRFLLLKFREKKKKKTLILGKTVIFCISMIKLTWTRKSDNMDSCLKRNRTNSCFNCYKEVILLPIKVSCFALIDCVDFDFSWASSALQTHFLVPRHTPSAFSSSWAFSFSFPFS